MQENKTLTKVELAEDKRSVNLFVNGLRQGFINEIKLEGVKNSTGQPLLHNKGYYTINEIPEGDGEKMEHAHHQDDAGQTADIISPKRPTEMPSDWTEGPEESIVMGTEPGLKFDIKEFSVKAGSKVKLTFNNNDDMLHNLLIVNPGTADAIGQQAVNLGLDGLKKGFIPESSDVLYHTNLMQPHTSDAIYFLAPDKPGKYQYVCTFPGHASVMRGVMIVE